MFVKVDKIFLLVQTSKQSFNFKIDINRAKMLCYTKVFTHWQEVEVGFVRITTHNKKV